MRCSELWYHWIIRLNKCTIPNLLPYEHKRKKETSVVDNIMKISWEQYSQKVTCGLLWKIQSTECTSSIKNLRHERVKGIVSPLCLSPSRYQVLTLGRCDGLSTSPHIRPRAPEIPIIHKFSQRRLYLLYSWPLSLFPHTHPPHWVLQNNETPQSSHTNTFRCPRVMTEVCLCCSSRLEISCMSLAFLFIIRPVNMFTVFTLKVWYDMAECSFKS